MVEKYLYIQYFPTALPSWRSLETDVELLSCFATLMNQVIECGVETEVRLWLIFVHSHQNYANTGIGVLPIFGLMMYGQLGTR